MSKSRSETVSALRQLSVESLHRRNRQARFDLAGSEWKMAAHLLATERSGLHRQKGFGSTVAYAQSSLNLHPQKASELLRVARSFELLPAISEAFRTSRLGWKKIREITRVAKPDTETLWLDRALANSGDALARMVSLSPRELKRGQALAAAREARASRPELSFSGPSQNGSEASAGLASTHSRPEVTRPSDSPCAHTETGTTAVSSGGSPTDVGSAPAQARAPVEPALVRVQLHFTPDEYALFEQAMSLVRARQGKRVSRVAAVVEMARTTLASADSRSKVRHQVLVHVDSATGDGFYETDRGLLPAETSVVEEAIKVGPVLVVGEEKAEQLTLVPTPAISPGKRKRPAVPMGVLRAAFARACGRCEKCGGKGGPFSLHHIRPWSKGGRHRLQELKLLCPACHGAVHERDFATDPAWQAGREAALRKRAAPGDAALCRRGHP